MRAPWTTLTLIGLAVVLTAGLTSCKKTPAPAPSGTGGETSTNRVSINIPAGDGYGATNFSPTAVTIAVGGTVVWNNQDGQVHSSVSDDNLWSSQINAGADFSRVFNTRGRFNFHCQLHAGMTGSVTVQ